MAGIKNSTLQAWRELPDSTQDIFNSLSDHDIAVLYNLAAPDGIDVVSYNAQTISLMKDNYSSFIKLYIEIIEDRLNI